LLSKFNLYLYTAEDAPTGGTPARMTAGTLMATPVARKNIAAMLLERETALASYRAQRDGTAADDDDEASSGAEYASPSSAVASEEEEEATVVDEPAEAEADVAAEAEADEVDGASGEAAGDASDEEKVQAAKASSEENSDVTDAADGVDVPANLNVSTRPTRSTRSGRSTKATKAAAAAKDAEVDVDAKTPKKSGIPRAPLRNLSCENSLDSPLAPQPAH
jgi:hypothetical protein